MTRYIVRYVDRDTGALTRPRLEFEEADDCRAKTKSANAANWGERIDRLDAWDGTAIRRVI